MKKIFTTLLLGLIFTGAFAQDFFTTPLQESGYRGFIDAGFGAGQLKGPKYMYRQWVVDISTTHGYQFDPHWFVGGGFDLYWCNQDDETFIPLYSAGRYSFKLWGFSPTIEGRIGMITYNNKWDHAAKIYLGLGGNIEIIPRILLSGRMTYFQTPFGNMALNATVGFTFVLGK